MDIQDVLRILKNGAEKPKDDLNDYTKGKRDGQVQAYSHAWTLVKNLSLSGVSQRSELLNFMEHLSMYHNIDEVIDCTKYQQIIEQYKV
tara:strand:- start:18541 stop:18807 length:267 start_codon:yes stop_codon:yes gene_type:complete